MINIAIEESSKNITPLSDDYFELFTSIFQQILEDFDCANRSVSLLICDNDFISKLNHTYRQKDYATDVLSFAFDDDEEFILEESSLGDIIISSEKALSQSKEFEVSYEEEFARLGIHGLLHLLGYDHELGDDEHREMFQIQDEYMNAFMQKFNGSQSSLI